MRNKEKRFPRINFSGYIFKTGINLRPKHWERLVKYRLLGLKRDVWNVWLHEHC